MTRFPNPGSLRVNNSSASLSPNEQTENNEQMGPNHRFSRASLDMKGQYLQVVPTEQRDSESLVSPMVIMSPHLSKKVFRKPVNYNTALRMQLSQIHDSEAGSQQNEYDSQIQYPPEESFQILGDYSRAALIGEDPNNLLNGLAIHGSTTYIGSPNISNSNLLGIAPFQRNQSQINRTLESKRSFSKLTGYISRPNNRQEVETMVKQTNNNYKVSDRVTKMNQTTRSGMNASFYKDNLARSKAKNFGKDSDAQIKFLLRNQRAI